MPHEEHEWEQATSSDLRDYLDIHLVGTKPRWLVRLEKCRLCPAHQLITLDAETGEERVRETEYR